jgi:hypothetical protein
MKYNNDNLKASISSEVGMDDYEKKYQMRKEKLIKKLGDNPIAKKLEEQMTRRENGDERNEEWESIDCLVWAARDLFIEKGDFNKIVSDLVNALDKLKGSNEKSIS